MLLAARQHLRPTKLLEAQKAVLPHVDPEGPAKQPGCRWSLGYLFT